MGEEPEDWWRGRRGGEEEEEDAKGKGELGFLEFLPLEPTSRHELGHKQNLSTCRTLALESWRVCLWVMAHQALGPQGLGAP